MGKDLKGKELGANISQEKSGMYSARFVDKFGKRQHRRFSKLQECRQWIAEARYADDHSDFENSSNLLVDSWYEFWIEIKKKTVRPNTVRNYSERYEKNIKPVIGKKRVCDVRTLDCQRIMNRMGDEGYKCSTIYQTRIALFNMLEFARENEVILVNPCKKSVKHDVGKTPTKKEALSITDQRVFLEAIKGRNYENQFRFALQTGLRTGELVGLQWKDVDFESRTLTIQRSMEFRYKVGEWRIGPPKSKSGYRKVPLTEEAIRILKCQREFNNKLKIIPMEWKNQVFLCRKGTPVKNSTYDTALFKVCENNNLPKFSMHILRHTFATRCIEAGMKPKTLQMILGHSNIGITMNLYVHTSEDEKLKEINMAAESLMAM